MMRREIRKRSVVLNGHKTSVSLEDDFWNCLVELSRLRRRTVGQIVETISDKATAAAETQLNLSSAIRLHILHAFMNAELPRNREETQERQASPCSM